MPTIETYFVQPCPVCGRSLQVSVQLLGREAACQHCGAPFVARDPACRPAVTSDPHMVLADRVDALLSISPMARGFDAGNF